MNAAAVEELVSQAKRLSVEDRELLLLRLEVELAPESVDATVEAAWVAEAERRVDAVDRGEMGTVPWDAVRKGLGLS